MSAQPTLDTCVLHPGLHHRGRGVHHAHRLARQPLNRVEQIAVLRNAQRGAAGQRQKHVAQQRVEGQADQLRHAVGRGHRKLAALPFDKVAQPVVPPQHGLGRAGAARGEEDVGRVVGQGHGVQERRCVARVCVVASACACACACAGPRGLQVVELGVQHQHGHGAGVGVGRIGRGVAPHQAKPAGFAFAQHDLAPQGRQRRVQRHKHGAAHQRGQHRGHHRRTARPGDGHHVTRLQARVAQALRQPGGSVLQRGVVVRTRAATHGGLRGRTAGLRQKVVHHRRERRRDERCRGVGQQGLRGRRQQRAVVHGHRRLRDHLLQQAGILVQQAAHGRSRQTVWPVDQAQADLARLGLDVQRQRDLGRWRCELHRLGLQARELQRTVPAAEGVDQHVEVRRVVGVTRGRELGHHAVERQLLVGPRFQRRATHSAQQFREARVAGQVGAQHQRVQQQPDHRLQFGPVAAGHGGAHCDVLLAEAAHQQQLEGGQQHHEHGGVVVAGQKLDAVHQLARQRQGFQRAGFVFSLDCGGLDGDAQRLQAGQLLAPVVQRAAQRAALQPRLFPEGDVAPLQRHGRQRRRQLLEVSGVQRCKFAQQNVQRPAVAHDVVNHDHDHVVMLAQPDHPGPRQRRLRQVERRVGKLRQALPQGGLALRKVFVRGQFDVLKQPLCIGLQPLARNTVGFDHPAVQAVVPRAQGLQAALQGLRIQRAAQPGRLGDVGWRRVDLQPVCKPQALLGRRQRGQGCIGRTGRMGHSTRFRRFGNGVVVRPRLLRRDGRGKLRHGRRIEQRAQRQLDLQCLAQP